MTANLSADLEYEMTVTNYRGQILYSSWKEIKPKSIIIERIFIQNEFCMITASVVFIKNRATQKIQNIWT